MIELPHDKTWNKFKEIKDIKNLVESALLLYSLLLDADNPRWLKSIAIAALVYLVAPLDTIPDFTPALGFIDDLAVLTATTVFIKLTINAHHKNQANELLNQL